MGMVKLLRNISCFKNLNSKIFFLKDIRAKPLKKLYFYENKSKIFNRITFNIHINIKSSFFFLLFENMLHMYSMLYKYGINLNLDTRSILSHIFRTTKYSDKSNGVLKIIMVPDNYIFNKKFRNCEVFFILYPKKNKVVNDLDLYVNSYENQKISDLSLIFFNNIFSISKNTNSRQLLIFNKDLNFNIKSKNDFFILVFYKSKIKIILPSLHNISILISVLRRVVNDFLKTKNLIINFDMTIDKNNLKDLIIAEEIIMLSLKLEVLSIKKINSYLLKKNQNTYSYSLNEYLNNKLLVNYDSSLFTPTPIN